MHMQKRAGKGESPVLRHTGKPVCEKFFGNGRKYEKPRPALTAKAAGTYLPAISVVPRLCRL